MDKVLRISVKAVIVKDERILLTRKTDKNGDFYLVPGGGQEHGETLAQTLVREVREETGFAATAGDLIFVRDYIGANHEFAATSSHFHQVELYFSASVSDAAPVEASQPDVGQVGVEWLPLTEVIHRRVYPLSLRQALMAQKSSPIYRGDVN